MRDDNDYYNSSVTSPAILNLYENTTVSNLTATSVGAGNLFVSSMSTANLNPSTSTVGVLSASPVLSASLNTTQTKPKPPYEQYVSLKAGNPQNEVHRSQYATTGGRKFDGGKLQYGLVPPNALEATVEILTFGAEKYEPDNWKRVPDAKRRYFDALNRHLWAWKKGEQNDQETGKNHLAHALCCLMFLYEHDTIDFSNDDKDVK